MKSIRFVLAVALLSLSTLAFAQSDAQKSFDKLKTLEGSWEGHVTTTPVAPEVEGKMMQVSLRVTSMGNAIMHEMKGAGRPDDPITMLYMDGDRLMLTHYCDAGNRPRMTGKMAPDGKTVEFEFLRRNRQHAIRTHAPRSVHGARLKSPHRGLDVHVRGQAGTRTPGSTADKLMRSTGMTLAARLRRCGSRQSDRLHRLRRADKVS